MSKNYISAEHFAQSAIIDAFQVTTVVILQFCEHYTVKWLQSLLGIKGLKSVGCKQMSTLQCHMWIIKEVAKIIF
jgi:hypothetical protein